MADSQSMSEDKEQEIQRKDEELGRQIESLEKMKEAGGVTDVAVKSDVEGLKEMASSLEPAEEVGEMSETQIKELFLEKLRQADPDRRNEWIKKMAKFEKVNPKKHSFSSMSAEKRDMLLQRCQQKRGQLGMMRKSKKVIQDMRKDFEDKFELMRNQQGSASGSAPGSASGSGSGSASMESALASIMGSGGAPASGSGMESALASIMGSAGAPASGSDSMESALASIMGSGGAPVSDPAGAPTSDPAGTPASGPAGAPASATDVSSSGSNSRQRKIRRRNKASLLRQVRTGAV